jgi:Homeodomain-like domain
LGVSAGDLESAERILSALYVERRWSQTKIADVLDVQPKTVNSWLKRLEIPIRSQGDAVSIALARHPIRSFDGSLKERAYLIGLRAGDLHAQTHGRRIRVAVGTTHPAMLELFESLFARYAGVKRYPKNSDIGGFHWCVYCELDSSFSFLLHKTRVIPKWICEDDDLFLSFFSGYFDAEGCVGFDFRPGHRSVSLIVQSCDRGILSGITKRLKGLGFDVGLNLALEAGERGCLSDFFSVKVNNRNQVVKLLDKLDLLHREKIAKNAIVRSLASNGWIFGWDDVAKLRFAIRDEVMACRSAAKAMLDKRKLEAGSTGPAMSRPPASTTVP